MIVGKRYGLYAVLFLNEEALTTSYNPDCPPAHQPKPYAKSGACKVGKVQGGFEMRQHEYEAVYGAENIVFIPLVVFDSVDEVVTAEKKFKEKYKEHRIGRSEHLNMAELNFLRVIKDIRAL